MKELATNLVKWSNIIYEEIQADEGKNSWFWPKSDEHEIFEQAYMKFVNRNLNYFNFPSIIAQVREGNEFNPALKKTLQFCRYVRTLDPSYSNCPFGRMCVWQLPPGKKLLPHRDNYLYHRFITRNIFIVSDNVDSAMEIRIENESAPTSQGSLWSFHPDLELHEFDNTKGERPFYFLGFDFWDVRRLVALQTLIDHETLANDNERLCTYGGGIGKKSKYISEH